MIIGKVVDTLRPPDDGKRQRKSGRKTVGTIYLLFTLCFGGAPLKIIQESFAALKNGGYLVIGMIPAGSRWGKYLAAKKATGHIFYKHANFYTIETVKGWLAEVGMSIVASRSTLYQPPGKVEVKEQGRLGLDEDAGFVIIAAWKKYA